MEPKVVVSILVAIALIYFRFGPGSRLLKKKSYHHIIPPASQDDPNWIPIDINEYDKIVLIKQNSIEDKVDLVINAIKNESPIRDFDVELINGWFKIKVPYSNFQDFHELIAFCDSVNGGNVYGYCKHTETGSKDYIVKIDSDTGYEHMIGAFRTNQNFGIYLPKSDKDPMGNISKSPVKEIDFQTEIDQIPFILE